MKKFEPTRNGYVRLAPILAAIMSFCQCTDSSKALHNLSSFYLPFEQLIHKPMLYHYQSTLNDSTTFEFWAYHAEKSENGIVINGQNFGSNGALQQSTKELVVENGVLIQEFQLHGADPAGNPVKIPVEIEAANVFPFTVSRPSGIFLYKAGWIPPEAPDTRYTVIKNRRYVGDTTFLFSNTSHPCVVFETRELVEHHAQGVWEQEFRGVEWYAKNLGLVFSKKSNLDENFFMEYKLTKVEEIQGGSNGISTN